MIYRQSFNSETINNGAALAIVLGGIFLLVWLGRLYADQIALSGFATFNLVLLQTTRILPQLLTVGLFAGMVITFNRMVQSNEYNAWAAAGLCDRDWQRTVLWLALPIAVVIAVLALHGVPWVIRFAEEYQRQLTEQAKVEDSAPGLFSELPDQDLVFHIAALSSDRQSAIGIFIIRQPQDKILQIMSAQRADTEIDAGGLRSLRMQQGHFHALDFATQSGSRITFNNADLDLSSQQETREYRLRARALGDLGDSAGERVEFWWRVSFPISLVLLCLLALPLGRSSPGSGRSYQALIAVLIYWLYYACAGLAKDYGIQKSISPLTAGLGPLLLLLIPLLCIYTYQRLRR